MTPAPHRRIPIHPALPDLNRRQAMSLMAASVALAGSACSAPPNERILPFVDLPEAQATGLPLYYASASVRDGFALGVLVGTREGRPLKIEGNPRHPSSLGATDVWAQASVLQLWDPDRSATVQQRLPGAGQPLAPSSWAAFETAWHAEAARLRQRDGDGLHLLLGPLTSPTDLALLARLVQRYPRMHVYSQSPPLLAGLAAGSRIAHGEALAPVYRLDRARCVLALAADPFSDGPGAVRQAADWASARAAGRAAGTPRLYAAEVAPGLFGARAERRVALPPQRIEALLWRLAGRWWPELGTPPGAADPLEHTFEQEVAHALHDAGPGALVVTGPGLSPEAHALGLALNQRLGAHGHTLDLIALDPAPPNAGALGALVQALQGGAVDTLFMLGVNPAYDAPGELRFSDALRHARVLVHAGLHADETALASHWHLPLSHDGERWGDALAHDGTATLVQPAIAPLYDSRSLTELLALMAGEATGASRQRGHALVRRQWRERLGGRDDTAFERAWHDSLRRGVIDGTTPAPRALAAARLPQRPPPAPEPPLVAWFTADPAVHHGQYANVGWLQELPRPFSKLTWDNALQLGPRTAQALGVATGDVVRATLDGRSVEAPVWVSPRQAEGVATLPLGYGRRAAGGVGTGVGFDAQTLLPAEGLVAPLTLQRTGRHHDFAVTQHSFDPHGRDPVRTVAPGERLAQDDRDLPSLYPRWRSPDHAWAMAIDLDACIGCNACTIACQAENNIPVVGREQVALGREMHWIRVDRYDDAAHGRSVFQPVPCMHCENAPCELVCPVGATVHDSDGLNVQVYNRCIGTRFCSNNCPYKVRRFNFLQFTDADTETLKGQRNPEVTVRERGVMEKCSYCLQRVARARHHADATGQVLADGDVVTACQAVCPTRAIHFGDQNDPHSDIAAQKASPRHYALLGELNTRPRTTYLARVEPPPPA
ncbi:MAG: 4Fe-4S dicluster domain-containing protein [Rhizobacter sp.]|nr:4Fe-4S dicluster domain-containing protein [Rhizobacter sp.]